MAKKSNSPSTPRFTGDPNSSQNKPKRTRKSSAEETQPLANSDSDIVNAAVDSGSTMPNRHPNGASFGSRPTTTESQRGSETRSDSNDISDMNERARDAGLDEKYTSGIGSGASPVGSAGEGFSDDEIRSNDDPRMNASDSNGETMDCQIGLAGGHMSNQSKSSMKNDRRGAAGSTIAAVFGDWNAASRAVDELYANDFSDSQIGIARMDRDGGAIRRGGVGSEERDQAKNVAGGVATGAAVGGVAGLLAALASLAIPGIGPIVAGGVLATTFGTAAGTAVAGAGIGAGVGAAAGGLVGALTDIGLSEDEARMYEERLRSGDTLITVNASDRATEARAILERNGGSSYGSGVGTSASMRGEVH